MLAHDYEDDNIIQPEPAEQYGLSERSVYTWFVAPITSNPNRMKTSSPPNLCAANLATAPSKITRHSSKHAVHPDKSSPIVERSIYLISVY